MMADQRVRESSTSSRCFNGLDDNNNDFFGLIGQIVNIIFNGSRVLHERFNSWHKYIVAVYAVPCHVIQYLFSGYTQTHISTYLTIYRA